MSRKDIKVKKELDRAGLARFLRDLADSLDRDRPAPEGWPEITGYRRLRIKVRREAGEVSASLKASLPLGQGEAPAGLTWSRIKKRLKSGLRILDRETRQGRRPPEEAMKAFLDDAASYLERHGSGADHDPFRRAVEDLRRACAAGDQEALAAAVREIGRVTSECHRKGK